MVVDQSRWSWTRVDGRGPVWTVVVVHRQSWTVVDQSRWRSLKVVITLPNGCSDEPKGC